MVDVTVVGADAMVLVVEAAHWTFFTRCETSGHSDRLRCSCFEERFVRALTVVHT